MSNFIKNVMSIVQPKNLVNGVYFQPHWQHTFNLAEESVLPQWSGEGGIAGVDVSVAEFNWLHGDDTTINSLRDAGYHHRDHLGSNGEVSIEFTYTDEERLEKAAEKLNHDGVTITNLEQMKAHFLENGMLAKYSTLMGCVSAMGFPETETKVIGGDGFVGSNHGFAFSHPQSGSNILFSHPLFTPSRDMTVGDCIKSQMYTYVPNQIDMRFNTTPFALVERIRMAEQSKDAENIVNVFEDYAAGVSNEIFDRLNIKVPEITGEVKNSIPEEVAHNVLDHFKVKSNRLHIKLNVSAISPMIDYSVEVFPYVIYGALVAKRTNTEYASFTIAADMAAIVEETELPLMIDAIDKMDPNAPMGTFTYNRAPEESVKQSPLTVEDLGLVNYTGTLKSMDGPVKVIEDTTEPTPTPEAPVEGDVVQPTAEVNQAYEG